MCPSAQQPALGATGPALLGRALWGARTVRSRRSVQPLAESARARRVFCGTPAPCWGSRARRRRACRVHQIALFGPLVTLGEATQAAARTEEAPGGHPVPPPAPQAIRCGCVPVQAARAQLGPCRGPLHTTCAVPPHRRRTRRALAGSKRTVIAAGEHTQPRGPNRRPQAAAAVPPPPSPRELADVTCSPPSLARRRTRRAPAAAAAGLAVVQQPWGAAPASHMSRTMERRARPATAPRARGQATSAANTTLALATRR